MCDYGAYVLIWKCAKLQKYCVALCAMVETKKRRKLRLFSIDLIMWAGLTLSMYFQYIQVI